MKTRTPDLLGMSYACANMVHCPGYADDLRQYTTLNRMYCIVDSKDNKVDKTREEADMTFSPFFPKVSKATQN